MRLDFGTEAGNVLVPLPVKIVREDAQPVDVGLETLGIHVAHVVILRGEDNTETNVVAQGLAHLLDKFHLVLAVLRLATSSLMSGPLPVDVDAFELPLRQELLERVDEGFAIVFGARHVRPGMARRTWV